MAFIHPFEGYLVAPDRAGAVVAPPYDSLSADERRRHADTHPESYLNAMRSLEEYASVGAPSLSTLLDGNARFLRRCIDEGRFVAQSACVFVYRLACSGHVQRGVVAEMSIGAYLDGRIKRHEFTRVAREDALAEYIDHVRAASSPVCLAYRADDGIRTRLDLATRAPSDISYTSTDGVVHDIWMLGGADATLAHFRVRRGLERLPHGRPSPVRRNRQILDARCGPSVARGALPRRRAPDPAVPSRRARPSARTPPNRSSPVSPKASSSSRCRGV